MGRKPNQLILEFFERGPKLEDSSNRYQHTCKSCGEKFPKGRIDSLTNHLLKKCPALPLKDRTRAVFQIHDMPVPEHMANVFPSVTHGPMMDLPFAPKHSMSALETLAEVSRQRLDLSGQPPGPANGTMLRRSSTRDTGNFNTYSPDDFLVSDDRPGNPDETGAVDKTSKPHLDSSLVGTVAEHIPLSTGLEAPSGNALPSIQYFDGVQASSSDYPNLPGLFLPQNGTSTVQMVPSPLQMAASAANELMMPNAGLIMEPELGVSNAGISDKFFHPQGRGSSGWPNIDPLLHEVNGQQNASQDAYANRAASHPRPIAVNPNSPNAQFATEFGGSQKPGKPKVRGRFSDSRRKEVQEVRKRGACIRCRMLKKPCSGESPCSTCVNVESARLWKQPCIRTRIAEEFGLYAASLHGVLAFHAINQVKSQVHFTPVPGRIEVTHFPESSVYITFTFLKGQGPVSASIDPALFSGQAASISSLSDLEILDADIDDLSGKLEQYIRRMIPKFMENEMSPFMRPTLAHTFSMSMSQKDGLSSRVLELWIATEMLANPSVHFHFFNNPLLPPSMTPITLTPADTDSKPSKTSRVPIDPITNRDSYNLIRTQLLSAIEKRAANLSKFIMNDLERRLLQRQQANQFETFLVAVILLACIERMCWLFETWESDVQQPSVTQTQEQPSSQQAKPAMGNPHSDDNTTNHTTEANGIPEATLQALQADPPPATQATNPSPSLSCWPLDKPPPFYSQQGERFSDILHMLLKMRGVPPKTAARPEDGVLRVVGEDADPAAREWFEAVGVTLEGLVARRDAGFVRGDWRCWELKYVGKILGAAG